MAESLIVSIINQFIYYPHITYTSPDFSPADLSLDFEDVVFYTTDNVALTGWYIKAPEPRHAVLYCHGNAGNRRDWVQAVPEFIKHNCNVFIFDYRGYGDSKGKPSELGLYLDGEAAWGWLNSRTENEHFTPSIFGKSLGTPIAVYLASQNTPKSLILDSALTSMREVIAFNALWVPKFLIPPMFESLEHCRTIHCPTLMLHGDKDRLVPVTQGLRLFRALQCPKTLHIIRGADHNDVAAYASYHDWIGGFLYNPDDFITQKYMSSWTNENWLMRKYNIKA